MSKLARLAAIAALAATFAVAPTALAAGAPADLDPSFGGDGIVAVERPSGEPFYTDMEPRMAIGPNDEIFVLYSTIPDCVPAGCAGVRCVGGCDIEVSVARYDRNGALDTSFGTGAGSSLLVHSGRFGQGAIAVGPDGRPVIAVFDAQETELAVARFDLHGHLDGSFGVNGRATTSVEGVSGTRPEIAVQADGKVVVGAESEDFVPGPEGEANLILARYLPDGSPDPGFGGTGRVALALGSPPGSQARPADLVLGAGGTVSVGVSECCRGYGTGPGVTFGRVLDSGGFDPAFLDGGRAFFATAGQSYIQALAAAPGGKLYALLVEEPGEVVIRMLPDGSLDPSFGTGGRVPLYARVPDFGVYDMVSDRLGRLDGVGSRGIGVFATRLRPDGSRDRTFAGGTYTQVDLHADNEAVINAALQSDGRLVLLAESGALVPPTEFALIGLVGGNSHSRCLGHPATIVGTRNADEITGTPHRDVIASLGGRDTVRALGGPDLICGGNGRDALFGGAGRDQVRP